MSREKRRRRYQSYSRPQSYLDPLSSDNRMAPVDITGTLLKEVRAFGDEIIETSEEKDIFRSNEKKRQDDLNKKILETKRIDKENPLNSLASEFNNQLNEIQKASLDAFKRGGNMDDVKRMEDNLNSSIDGVLEVTAGLDAIGNPIRDLDDSGLDRNVLYSQFDKISDGIDPSKRELFLNVLQNPSRVNYKFNEGDWIIQYKNDDGSIVDAFNGSEIKNAIKDGFEVIKMADDDSKRIQDLSAEVSKGLDDIVSQEVITAYKDSNKTLTTTQKTNYEKALKKMDERLENDPAFEALITESNYQMYVNKKDRLDSKGNYIQFGDVDSYKKTKEALKNKIIDSKFPGGAEVLNKIIKKPASSSGSSSKQKVYVDYKDWVRKSLSGNEVPYAPGRAPGDYSIVAKKLMDINPNRFLLGKSLKASEVNEKIKEYENFDDDKLYVKNGKIWEPYIPLDTDLNLDKINQILIDATQPDVENKKASIL